MVALLVVPGQDHSLIPLEDPPDGQVPVVLRGKRVLSLATVFNTVALRSATVAQTVVPEKPTICATRVQPD
jgi:hypothetical protein